MTQKQIRPFCFAADVLEGIMEDIGDIPPEAGGLLGSTDGYRIDRYFYDKDADTTTHTYTPNIKNCYSKIREWEQEGIEFVGFFHSHPDIMFECTSEDLKYADRIMKVRGMEDFVMAIVISSVFECDEYTGFNPVNNYIGIYPYVFNRATDGSLYATQEFDDLDEKRSELEKEINSKSNDELVFSKIKNITPLDVLKKKHLGVIGTGGVSGFVEAMAREGIGNITLIDPDYYAFDNIPNQHCYANEVGTPKVKALAKRLKYVNPDINVTTRQLRITEDVSLEDFAAIFPDGFFKNPEDNLICISTDNFESQKLLTSYVMKLGVPFIAPQMYENGAGAEVCFYYPGVTPTCPECILHSRYKAHEKGNVKKVTSNGTLISSVMYANAVETQIAMTMLCYNEKDSRFYHWLDRVKDRNLALLRLAPEAGATLGLDFLDTAMSTEFSFFGETCWIPVKPLEDCPICSNAD